MKTWKLARLLGENLRYSTLFTALSLAALLSACSRLPVAPMGPLGKNASQDVREYKIRKHRVNLGLDEGSRGGMLLGREPMGYTDLVDYFKASGLHDTANATLLARGSYRRGLALGTLGSLALAPIGIGFYLPILFFPAADLSARRQLKPAVLLYNASLSEKFLGPQGPPELPGL